RVAGALSLAVVSIGHPPVSSAAVGSVDTTTPQRPGRMVTVTPASGQIGQQSRAARCSGRCRQRWDQRRTAIATNRIVVRNFLGGTTQHLHVRGLLQNA